MTLPPEPRANPDLVGHDDPARTLEEAARSGRLHHAWLIAGPTGVGKATLAYRFARWLLAGLPDAIPGRPPLELPESHPAFRRIAAGAHADLFTLAPNAGERGKKEILRADDARGAVRFMSLTAAEGGWRAIVMEDVERTDTQAVQNILLKTLEEPPPRTVQLLVTAAPDRLLPTIRSRCRRLDLAPLPQPVMKALLARWLPEMSGPDRIRLAGIADGCPGTALALAEGEGLALQGLVEQVLEGLPRLDARRVHVIADGVAGRRDAAALAVFFSLLRRALAAGLRQAGRGGKAAPWLAGRSLAEWSTLWDKLGRLADETERLNLDRKQAVLTGLGWLSMR
ncbi:DNA polymerase III subunit delta' [Paracraurococcus lichenis]|uniref:DNA polymerase III subunit delta n=1 Tax=Paracraurococcus lichenis TaxID=3064888 RepID=A0ABT9DXK7_9PROT|nr:DNA polymerase III subunit delta' [Paracraurococcus sp. LOR1-02]MDO9708635.1 DNA polymerase III subunit delta' [Paracraurococcus sp. LOR1-02]